MIWAAAIALAFVGLYLQLAALTGRMFAAASCPDCRKGRRCPACLAASEAIRPKPETQKEAA